MNETVMEQARKAKSAARGLANVSSDVKNVALLAIADALTSQADAIKDSNASDVAQGLQRGLSAALLDRLTLTDLRIAAMSEGLRQIAALPDPVGQTVDGG